MNRRDTHQIGNLKWSREELVGNLEEFSKIYERRPIKINNGGMKAPQIFFAWFVAKKLQPNLIVESGVWYGQGTWVFEQAAPKAEIYCLDPIPYYERGYKSEKAKYISSDFLQNDWTKLEKSNSLCFFDDHQDALNRIVKCKQEGFNRIMFEDNYPLGQGDCYSLKKAFDEKDNKQALPGLSVKDYLNHIIDTYFEFPPVFSADENRWGLPWNIYSVSETLLKEVKQEYEKIYLEELDQYTWINYVELKS